MVLDTAPVHVSTEFRAAMEQDFPWVKMVFVPPRMMHCCQPLDLAYMVCFKIMLARKAAKHFARQAAHMLGEGGEVHVDM